MEEHTYAQTDKRMHIIYVQLSNVLPCKMTAYKTHRRSTKFILSHVYTVNLNLAVKYMAVKRDSIDDDNIICSNELTAKTCMHRHTYVSDRSLQ